MVTKKRRGTPIKLGRLPAWDLSDLFSGPEDPKIKTELKRADKMARSFRKRFRSRDGLTFSGSDKDLLQALKAYEKLQITLTKLVDFASLWLAESASDPNRGAFWHEMQHAVLAIDKEVLFFGIQLGALNKDRFSRLSKQKAFRPYLNFIKQLTLSHKHRLSEDKEALIADFSLAGRGSFIRLFDEENALRLYQLKAGKKEESVNQSKLLQLAFSARRSDRKQGAKALSAGLSKEKRRLSFIYNTLIHNKQIEDRYRGFRHPAASRYLADQLSAKMVDTLEEVVVCNYPQVHEFYRFKRKLLKLKELYDYDRYAPLGKQAADIPFKKASEMVLESFSRFSGEMASVAELFFKNNWIDAAARKGKRGGAFCSFVTPDLHPYVFVNYLGTLNDVSTLAHELGHAVHAYLFREQGICNFATPLPVAETASVFAEMLLFEYLKDRLRSRAEAVALYASKLDGIIATVFRQIALYRFELRVHSHYREHGELSTAQFCDHWIAEQRLMHGNSVKLTDSYAVGWSYIPHFIHAPFYVYAYAFGELLTLALYAKHQEGGSDFVSRYLELLKAGASKTPAELVKPFGVNLSQIKFWQGGMNTFAEMLSELKRL